jgi:hypothetical protein
MLLAMRMPHRDRLRAEEEAVVLGEGRKVELLHDRAVGAAHSRRREHQKVSSVKCEHQKVRTSECENIRK